MARLAEALSQTFKTFSPDGLADRLFGDSLDDWWQEAGGKLLDSDYSTLFKLPSLFLPFQPWVAWPKSMVVFRNLKLTWPPG